MIKYFGWKQTWCITQMSVAWNFICAISWTWKSFRMWPRLVAESWPWSHPTFTRLSANGPAIPIPPTTIWNTGQFFNNLLALSLCWTTWAAKVIATRKNGRNSPNLKRQSLFTLHSITSCVNLSLVLLCVWNNIFSCAIKGHICPNYFWISTKIVV